MRKGRDGEKKKKTGKKRRKEFFGSKVIDLNRGGIKNDWITEIESRRYCLAWDKGGIIKVWFCIR